MKVKTILEYLEERFPYELAADFDQNKIGLALGDEEDDVKGILCALDLSDAVIEEAINKNCNLIITHHPLTFVPMTKFLKTDEKGHLIFKLIQHNISLIAMHTNMDLGKDGVADTLCLLFELQNSNYGVAKKDEYIRYGNIQEMTLKELAIKTKEILNVDGVKVIGELNKKISKIGILGGSGAHESDIENAIKFGCECYITGEIKHHIGLMANFNNLCLIEVNHGIEKCVFKKLAKDIECKSLIKTYISEVDSNLFRFI